MVELPLSPPISQIFAFSYSMAGVFLVIGLTDILVTREKLTANSARNFLCIVACFWTIIAPYFFVDWYWAISGPVFFLLINTAAVFWNFMPSLYPEPGRLGAVMFTVFLIVAVLAGWLLARCHGIHWRLLAPLSVVPAGFADSASAFCGRRWGKRKLRGERTVVGTVSAAAAAVLGYSLVLLIFGINGWAPWLVALLGGLLCALTELFSPPRLDNLLTGLTAAAGAAAILLLAGP